jgi:hypothetical protein
MLWLAWYRISIDAEKDNTPDASYLKKIVHVERKDTILT